MLLRPFTIVPGAGAEYALGTYPANMPKWVPHGPHMGQPIWDPCAPHCHSHLGPIWMAHVGPIWKMWAAHVGQCGTHLGMFAGDA